MSALSGATAACSARAVPSESKGATSAVTRIARSAPSARPRRKTSSASASPTVTTTTSPTDVVAQAHGLLDCVRIPLVEGMVENIRSDRRAVVEHVDFVGEQPHALDTDDDLHRSEQPAAVGMVDHRTCSASGVSWPA